MVKLPLLIENLARAGAYDHETHGITVLETHISWVILTGSIAYKIKKPVNLGFLDFSTLELRQHYCEEELRLNRRFASNMYMGVVPITGTIDRPEMNGTGTPLEFAVQMRQFPQEVQLDRLLDAGEIDDEGVMRVAEWVADFHHDATRVPKKMPFGEPLSVMAPVLENFEQIIPRLSSSTEKHRLTQLLNWSRDSFVRWRNEFQIRKNQDHIRECHGDLHLSNMIMENESVLAFDCIEFSESLRYIDTICDTAFLMMDLMVRKRDDLAFAFLNKYLEQTGDYRGAQLINFYMVYRTMVRAKVAIFNISGSTLGESELEEARNRFDAHISLAERLSGSSKPCLLIMNGLSGSGKTWLSQKLLRRLPALGLRSDIERKRLFGLSATQSSNSDTNQGIYTPSATNATYDCLAQQAELLLNAGHTVIVDAAFLEQDRRERFCKIAKRANAPYLILRCEASKPQLQQRIIKRADEATDASEAGLEILEHQFQHYDALNSTELGHTLSITTPNVIRLLEDIRKEIDGHSSQQRLTA